MTDPSFLPEDARELVAVYPDRSRAESARQAVLDLGVPTDEVHLGDDLDAVTSLRAEMHEELTRALVVPNAGIAYPKEASRGLGIAAIAGAVLGLLAAFPLALIPVGESYWVRWVIFAAVGVAFGVTVALVAGPATAAPRPGELPAAARGTVLRVERDSPELRGTLESFGAVRLDEVSHAGDPIATVSTESEDTLAETADEMRSNTEGDDYHPQ